MHTGHVGDFFILSIRYAVLAAAAASFFALGQTARAEFKVQSAIVEGGVLEYENIGSLGRDSRGSHDHETSMVNEVEYGVTDRWMTEIEGEWGREPPGDNGLRYRATTWGNQLQLFETGSQWLETSLWGEYSRATRAGGADTVKFGPLLQKDWGPTTTTINLFLEKEVGPGGSGGADGTYAAQFRYDWRKSFAPAIEIYGDVGDISHVDTLNNQQHRAGPVLTGAFGLGPLGELKYEVGYLVGLTSATPQNTYKWRLEYEIAF